LGVLDFRRQRPALVARKRACILGWKIDTTFEEIVIMALFYIVDGASGTLHHRMELFSSSIYCSCANVIIVKCLSAASSASYLRHTSLRLSSSFTALAGRILYRHLFPGPSLPQSTASPNSICQSPFEPLQTCHKAALTPPPFLTSPPHQKLRKRMSFLSFRG